VVAVVLGIMLAVRFVVVAFALAAAEKMQAPSSFMLVSGVSSPREMCLVGMGPAGALLDECTAALAELDGREVWSLTGSGSLTNLAAKKCLAAQPDAAAGSAVELAPCDEAGKSSTWELQANGQIKLGASNMCLSQAGPSPGRADLASSSAVVASSTLDPAHGAALVVDGLASSYWVSKLDEAGPVSLTLEFDKAAPVLEVELDFEFAPSSFVLQSLGASGKWIDEFATDTNILRTAKLPLAGGPAYGVRLVMNKAHATQAVLGGHSIFGVRSFKVLAPLMRPVVEPCVVAAKSSDARDKYFAVAVGSFDPSSGAALRSELPALDSAGAAVAAAVTELAEAVPDARACKKGAAFKSKAGRRQTVSSTRKSLGGAEIGEQEALFVEAKKTIIAARSILQ